MIVPIIRDYYLIIPIIGVYALIIRTTVMINHRDVIPMMKIWLRFTLTDIPVQFIIRLWGYSPDYIVNDRPKCQCKSKLHFIIFFIKVRGVLVEGRGFSWFPPPFPQPKKNSML